MKVIFTYLFLVLSITSQAQAQAEVIGDYQLVVETKDSSKFEYKLTLSQDGTFIFNYYSKISMRNPPEENKSGKGTWTTENNVISFFTEEKKDLDEKNILDFSNSKARFITKSPRDKTDRIVDTKLIFLKSEISWMERIEMLKI